MKKIVMKNGEVIVDDEDFDMVSKYTWYYCNGYAKAHMKGESKNKPGEPLFYRREYMHRLIMNPPKGMFVDHINHNTLDNRRANLRIVNRQQQQWNLRGMMKVKNKSSRFKGISKKKRADGTLFYTVQIRVDSKVIYVGAFGNEYDAAKAYDVKAKEVQGEYACLNFPEG